MLLAEGVCVGEGADGEGRMAGKKSRGHVACERRRREPRGHGQATLRRLGGKKEAGVPRALAGSSSTSAWGRAMKSEEAGGEGVESVEMWPSSAGNMTRERAVRGLRKKLTSLRNAPRCSPCGLLHRL